MQGHPSDEPIITRERSPDDDQRTAPGRRRRHLPDRHMTGPHRQHRDSRTTVTAVASQILDRPHVARGRRAPVVAVRQLGHTGVATDTAGVPGRLRTGALGCMCCRPPGARRDGGSEGCSQGGSRRCRRCRSSARRPDSRPRGVRYRFKGLRQSRYTPSCSRIPLVALATSWLLPCCHAGVPGVGDWGPRKPTTTATAVT